MFYGVEYMIGDIKFEVVLKFIYLFFFEMDRRVVFFLYVEFNEE